MTDVRTRFAPSPTGFFHIGGIRTILYCYAMAKKNNGQFIVRIEDTDRTRSKEAFIQPIFDAIDAYKLTEDESIRKGGEHGPYRQSERIDIYRPYAEMLIERGYAYYCFLTKEETEELQKEFMKENKRFRSPYRDLGPAEAKAKVEAGETHTVRLKVPEDRTFHYEDGVQGKMKFHSDEIVDQVLLKQDGFPTYHLAVCVDDSDMRVSHVFRGFEWIPSTPIQILVYEGIEKTMPQHYHLSTILDPAGGKLSKRKGATSAMAFIEQGYLPAAMNNFLMLLGWSAPIKREHGEKEREIFSVEEFVDMFDVKDLNKSNAIFDDKKLEWFNKEYIKNTETDELVDYFKSWLEKYHGDSRFKIENSKIINDENLNEKVKLVQERSKTLTDMVESLEFFYSTPDSIDWDIKQTKRLRKADVEIADILAAIKKLHESFEEDATNWTHERWEEGMRAIGDKFDLKHGDVFMALRLAVVGSPFSPPLFESLQILGKDEVLERIEGVSV